MRISFLRPIDQFAGKDRLLERLRQHLSDSGLSHMRLVVAYAKIGPLLRLQSLFDAWSRQGKTVEAIFGIDQRGTSMQALEFAVKHFTRTYICHTLADSTFHAKFYLFSGDRLAICIYGSHNMTVGGTETNLESGTQLEISRPGEETLFQEALGCWTSLLPENCSMTRAVDRGLIDELLRSGLLFDEGAARDATALGEGKGAAEILPKIFPRARPKPPTPIPREAFVKITRSKRRVAVRGTRPRSRVEKAPPAQALVMQIVPHHNGEVFLSKNAINENPGFFGFPFSGKTVPKKSSNPSYPQRVPDPLVNVSVFGRGDKPLITRRSFNLNMVYYEKKSEIRITLSPDLAGKILPFAAMVMRLRVTPYDYDIEVFNPDSTSYDQFVSACNQTLPSGGAARPRKYGWL